MAQKLFDSEDYRDCASRAYYAAYQAATSVCVLHGDSVKFPIDRNNPSHDQLPLLIIQNGDLSKETRRKIRRILRALRRLREDADYRPGRTVGKVTARLCLRDAAELFRLL